MILIVGWLGTGDSNTTSIKRVLLAVAQSWSLHVVYEACLCKSGMLNLNAGTIPF